MHLMLIISLYHDEIGIGDIQSNLGCRNSCSNNRGMVSRSSLLYARQCRMVSIADGITETAIEAGSTVWPCCPVAPLGMACVGYSILWLASAM